MTVALTPRIVFVRWVTLKTSRTWSPSSSPREVNTVPGLSGNHGLVTWVANRSGDGSGGEVAVVDDDESPWLRRKTAPPIAAAASRLTQTRMTEPYASR